LAIQKIKATPWWHNSVLR